MASTPTGPGAGDNDDTVKYRGVSYSTEKGKWRVSITVDGDRANLGYFVDQEEAARAYDRAAVRLKGIHAKLNFPEELKARLAEIAQENASPTPTASDSALPTTPYRNVKWDKITKKWKSTITVNGVQKHLGYFNSDKEAFDAQVIHRERVLSGDVESDDATKAKTSIYRGVLWRKDKKKWAAAVTHDYKKIHVGYFDNENQAAHAYDEKAHELKGSKAKLNFPSSFF